MKCAIKFWWSCKRMARTYVGAALAAKLLIAAKAAPTAAEFLILELVNNPQTIRIDVFVVG